MVYPLPPIALGDAPSRGLRGGRRSMISLGWNCPVRCNGGPFGEQWKPCVRGITPCSSSSGRSTSTCSPRRASRDTRAGRARSRPGFGGRRSPTIARRCYPARSSRMQATLSPTATQCSPGTCGATSPSHPAFCHRTHDPLSPSPHAGTPWKALGDERASMRTIRTAASRRSHVGSRLAYGEFEMHHRDPHECTRAGRMHAGP